MKSKFVQPKDKFNGINKQIQFTSSNLHLYKHAGTISAGGVKLCSDDDGEQIIEVEFSSDDQNDVRYHQNIKISERIVE